MPVSVAVAGLGPTGRQHLERLIVSPDYAARAVCDVNPEQATHGVPVLDWRGLVSRSDIDVVFVAVEPSFRAARTVDALASGKHVVVALPLAQGVSDAEAVLNQAKRAGRSLIVMDPGLWDDDFCLARQVVESGVCGKLELASLCLWQHFPGSRAPEPITFLRDRGAVFVHQLLALIPSSPVSVTCRALSAGFCLFVDFDDGAVGQLQLHRQAFPAVDTGWTLTGSRGGYAHHTQYVGILESEIVDEPLTLTEDPATAFYTNLARHAAGRGPNPSPADRQPAVLAILESATRSLVTKATIEI